MTLNMGERIRELRRERGFTQDEVARRLNISSQAVSKWENAASYPDLELIPPLAELLGVSIDALFREDDKEETQIICERADALLLDPAHVREGLPLLREAVIRHPFHTGLLRRLGTALFVAYQTPEDLGKTGTNENGEETVVTHGEPWLLREAIAAYERALNSAKEQDERDDIVKSLTAAYALAGQREDARRMAEQQSRMAFSREIMLADIEEGAKREEASANALINLLVQTAALVLKSIGCVRREDEDELRRIHADRCVSTARFIESLFPDGRCGRLHFFIAQLYYYPTALYSALDDFEKADACFVPMWRHEKANRVYGEGGSYRYTSPLFSKITEKEPRYVKYEPTKQFFTDEYKAHLREAGLQP